MKSVWLSSPNCFTGISRMLISVPQIAKNSDYKLRIRTYIWVTRCSRILKGTWKVSVWVKTGLSQVGRTQGGLRITSSLCLEDLPCLDRLKDYMLFIIHLKILSYHFYSLTLNEGRLYEQAHDLAHANRIKLRNRKKK